ncbi:uncharacterized protein GGS22DRAFT_156265 [Annulohypoxylon maeteangense]|uniref:uncharacterized protein n=1 Tax=Annulohypoxylon maeteangense TaxID=1927788 RepID=UPI0020072D96|nr:uncharacterized protein GGS22DRAFT_156265 [Annulohypoxylon maeteangense]KAI0887142.1 hypothetical protein GGS22DRAFT_156265 [Annulohypoxylon maeteangense]
MAPIPVYTDSPIAASKPSGVTPQTAGGQASSASNPATTSTSPTPTRKTSYPSAQPGATPSLPAPTGAISQAYLPQNSPPAPQPGAFPTPPGTTGTNIPPPPKAGERYQPPQQTSATQPMSIPYPPQMSMSPPSAPYAAQQRGTSTASVPTSVYSGPGPTAVGGPPTQSLQHPPGYHQNVNASELDMHQRSAIQQSELESQGGDSSGVWDSAKKWAQQTGEKLAAAENEVWKKLNKD